MNIPSSIGSRTASLGLVVVLATACGDDAGAGTDATTTASTGAADGVSTGDADGSTGVDGTTTDAATDTGPPPPADVCPLVDGDDVLAVALRPILFDDGDDPSRTEACAFENPERGLHRFVDLRALTPAQAQALADEGTRVLYGRALIAEYVDAPLDDAVLAEIDAGFVAVRAAGLSVAPRFYYADAIDQPDAPLPRVLEHIGQLAPLWAEHADVMVALQAGFVGAWGEWHSSTNDLTAPAARAEILDALLAALPPERQVQVRRPSFKQVAYGGPVTPDTAHDGSDLARLGHLNDCFLASDDDFGTYVEPGEKDYAIADSAFVAMGGETCAVNPPRSECASALDELALLHWSYLNRDYHPDVIAGWQAEGCLPRIACRLGYRLAVTDVRWQATASGGASWSIELTIHNDGFAAPINARPLQVVLDGPQTIVVETALDVRTFAAGEDTVACMDLALPADAMPGTYDVGLRLPHATLGDDPRYAIRLVGPSWDPATGDNALPVQVTLR